MVRRQHHHAPGGRQDHLERGPQRLVSIEPGLHHAGEARSQPALIRLVVWGGHEGRRDPDPGKSKP